MSLKLMEQEQRDNSLKKAKEALLDAMDHNPIGLCFVVMHESGEATMGAGGGQSATMIGHVESMKTSLILNIITNRRPAEEGSDEVH
jgi:hypothetical protein